MAILHASLALTILAIIAHFIGIFLPCWMIFTSTFSEDVQIGVFNFCVNWKNCHNFADLDFAELGLDFSIIPEQIRELFGQLIIPSMLLMMAECTAVMTLCTSLIICIVAICIKSKTRLIKIHLGLNVASCFVIMCGIFSSVSFGGDWRILNALGDFLRIFNISFRVSYGYSMYLVATAAFLSLISGILCCCIGDNYTNNNLALVPPPPFSSDESDKATTITYESSIQKEGNNSLSSHSQRSSHKSSHRSSHKSSHKSSRNSSHQSSRKSSRQSHNIYESENRRNERNLF